MVATTSHCWSSGFPRCGNSRELIVSRRSQISSNVFSPVHPYRDKDREATSGHYKKPMSYVTFSSFYVTHISRRPDVTLNIIID